MTSCRLCWPNRSFQALTRNLEYHTVTPNCWGVRKCIDVIFALGMMYVSLEYKSVVVSWCQLSKDVFGIGSKKVVEWLRRVEPYVSALSEILPGHMSICHSELCLPLCNWKGEKMVSYDSRCSPGRAHLAWWERCNMQGWCKWSYSCNIQFLGGPFSTSPFQFFLNKTGEVSRYGQLPDIHNVRILFGQNHPALVFLQY